MLRALPIALLALALPAAASAAVVPAQAPISPTVKLTEAQARSLWATVNICDTEDHPDTVGVSASMPTIKRANRLYMRFRLQYRDDAAKAFKPVPGPNADSGWTLMQPRKGKVRRAGYDFMLSPPTTGFYVVRAAIDYQWRRGTDLLLSARRITTDGHTATKAADPARFSAAVCQIE